MDTRHTDADATTHSTATDDGARRRRTDRRRGQTAIIAIVLLFGLVAVGSIGILLVGGQATDSARDSGQDEQIRKAFVQLHSSIDSVAFGPERSRTIDIDLPSDSEAAVRKDNTGTITIVRRNLTDTQTVVVKDIGSVVYERGDTLYAYQAGAVWKGTGRNAQMVSAPGLDYSRNDTGGAPTLTFPIVDLTGDKQLTSGAIGIRKGPTRAPLNDVSTIDNQIVKIVIQSKYYYGWGQYFDERYDGAVVSYRDSSNTAVIKLGRRNINGQWAGSVYSTAGDIVAGTGNSGVDGDVYAPGSIDCGKGSCNKLPAPPDGRFSELDDVIQQKVDRAENDPDYATERQIKDGVTLSGKSGGATYYDDDGFALNKNSKVTVDLSKGNVTLIVDGNLNLTKADFKVKNGDGDSGKKAFRVFTTGNLTMKNARFCGDSDCTTSSFGSKKTAEDLQIYGDSRMAIGLRGGNTKFEGAIYAPRETEIPGPNLAHDGSNGYAKCNDGDDPSDGTYPNHADVCIVNGDGAIYGSIVAGPMKLTQSTFGTYDSSLDDVKPQLMSGGVLPPRLTYLHVSVTEVAVSQEDG